MRDSAGASYYYTTDALGSVILLTDGSQAKAATYGYDSWGQATSATGAQAATNPWTYAGGYNDTTSNRIKFGARYYNPARGRFTQSDPSGQEANRYLYTGGDPINNIDPNGLEFLGTGDWYGCGPYNTATCAGYDVPLISDPSDTFACRLDTALWFVGGVSLLYKIPEAAATALGIAAFGVKPFCS